MHDRVDSLLSLCGHPTDPCVTLAAGRRALQLMLGSHNTSSAQRCVAGMAALGMDHEACPVFFGQLMGMSDHLSFTLGHHGYR